MLVRTNAIPSVAVLAVGLLSLTMPPAEALTMKECGAKYQAAKTSGTLSGQSWNDFRKTQCGQYRRFSGRDGALWLRRRSKCND